MRVLERNKTTFYYALYAGKQPIKDEYGNESGEYRVRYGTPVRMRANVSPAGGSTQAEQFGTSIQYDKVIVTDDLACPINENSILFIDILPPNVLCDTYGRPICTEANDVLQFEQGREDVVFDYIVKKIARSLNSISIAISKVAVS